MESEHKTFKPFDKVLVRQSKITEWECDIYSHYNAMYNTHTTIGYDEVEKYNILPYEGNEQLAGTKDETEEEIRLEKGEWLFVSDDFSFRPEEWFLRKFDKCKNGGIYAFNTSSGKLSGWNYAIRFADFTPNDMTETLKHILCVKNGKIVKYRG